jgi:hypothetical protein
VMLSGIPKNARKYSDAVSRSMSLPSRWVTHRG